MIRKSVKRFSEKIMLDQSLIIKIVSILPTGF
jgi:hypothetical protein